MKEKRKISVFRLHVGHLSFLLILFIIFCVCILTSLKFLMKPYFHQLIYESVRTSFENKKPYLVMLMLSNEFDEVNKVISEKNFIELAITKEMIPFSINEYKNYALSNRCRGELQDLNWALVCKGKKLIQFEIPLKSADNLLAYLLVETNSNVSLWAPYKIVGRGLFLMMFIVIVSYFLLIARFYLQFAKPIKTIMTKLIGLKEFLDFSNQLKLVPIKELYDLACEVDRYHSLATKNLHLVSIGQSAASIAHDVRKPLTLMKSMVAVLPKKKDDPLFISEMTRSVERSINRTNTMLSDILEFSKDAQSLNLGHHDPQSLITSALSDTLRTCDVEDISIEYDLKHKNYLNVDSDRIVRVLTNVIGNAVEAMRGKGRIWIKTSDKLGSLSSLGRLSSLDKLNENNQTNERNQLNHSMQIVIGDNGPLIPEEVQKRLFEPFFTHDKKGGTGLGLAICQKIIDMHGGSIQVTSHESPVTRKTEFTIELPATPGNLRINDAELIRHSSEFKPFLEEEAKRISYSDAENTETFMRIHKEKGRPLYMLLVDDEPLFRMTIHHTLSNLSQVKDHVRIVEVDSAEMALKQFDEQKFDYVVADIDLGVYKMNGYEFSQLVLEKYPNTYVLIHSNKRKEELDIQIRQKAKGERQTATKGEERGMRDETRFLGFLPKPMNESQLLQFLAGKSFETEDVKCRKLGSLGSLGQLSSLKKHNENNKLNQPNEHNHSVIQEKKILIVNDDAEVATLLSILLDLQGVKSVKTYSVKEALSHVKEKDFDMVLSDINLGDDELSGYDLLKEIRQASKDTPFYFVSGYNKRDEEPKAKELGATGYLQMPIEDDDLKKIVDMHINAN